jgi:hypothetical protein
MSAAIDDVLDRDIPKRNTTLTVVLSSFIGNTIE